MKGYFATIGSHFYFQVGYLEYLWEMVTFDVEEDVVEEFQSDGFGQYNEIGYNN
jgi:hypothetical protein